MKNKINTIKDIILKFINEKRNYCIIGAIAVIVVFAVISIFIIMPKDVINYPGNLINNGFAANSGKWTYFIKQDGIYKVNSKGDNIERVSEAIVSYLNSDGRYLYFCENIEGQYNLVKMKKNGKDKQNIVENIDNKMITVSKKWIYYSQNEELYKIRTNGKDRIKLLDKDVQTYQIEGNNIYYTLKDGIDCVIAKMKINGTDMVELEKDCNPNFYVKGSKIYYIKETYNTEKYEYEYTLCEMKENGNKKKEIKKLPNSIKQINMAEDGIYYLTTEDYTKYELLRIKYNGKDEAKVTETAFNTKINVINKEIYYMDIQNSVDVNVYRINNSHKQNL